MTSSLPKDELDRLLSETLRLLSKAIIGPEIEDPIDNAVGTFKYDGDVSVLEDRLVFLDAVGKFVAHVYRYGLSFPRVLGSRQAQAEALNLLERGYRRNNSCGYEGALCDTMKYGMDGLRAVFFTLAEIVKETQRQHYIWWVLNSRVQQLDWNTRRDLTAIILERLGPGFREGFDVRSVEELVPLCAELLLSDVGSTQELRQVFGAAQRAGGVPG
jgi:hypothetical protein